MNGSRRHTIPRLLPVLVVSVLLATCATASIASATSSSQAGLGGIWSGTYSGSYRGTFTIRWTQGRSGALKGSIALSNPHGTYPINGKVNRKRHLVRSRRRRCRLQRLGRVVGKVDVRSLEVRRRGKRQLERPQDQPRLTALPHERTPSRTQGPRYQEWYPGFKSRRLRPSSGRYP